MNTAKYVDQMVTKWKQEGQSLPSIAWNAALLCVGWPYVYSSWGAECTPAERRKRYRMCPDHEAIKTKCKAFDSGDCSGCKWFPGGERVRCFDCRGFTDKVLNWVGIDLYGDTCGVQWNHKKNWAAQGLIATMPKDKLCCLFVRKDGKFIHTGLGLNNEVCDCGNNVQHTKSRPAKWTHWAVPAGLYEGAIQTTEPEKDQGTQQSTSSRQTLRKGNKGPLVKELQGMLDKLGYNLGICGIDGDYGTATAAAVRSFQSDHRLTVDGVCGPKTWAELEKAVASITTKPEEPEKVYAVVISGLDKTQAETIAANYPANSRIIEGSVA